jgi:tetratricopeptide (TPR) repeat protein
MSGWQLDPDTRMRLRRKKADDALAKRDWEAMVVELEELLDESPDNVDALWSLAEGLIELRDFLTAREACRAALELSGGRAGLWVLLALCQFETYHFDEAVASTDKALEICEDLGEAWYIRGLCLERMDDPEAEACLRKAHRLQPLAHSLPLPLSQDDWQLLLSDAFAVLPEELQAFWKPVPVRLVRFPDAKGLRDQVPLVSPRIPALYVGEPDDQPGARPDALTIFVGNLAHNDTPDAVVQQLVHALEGEALDWLRPLTEPEPR